MSAGSWPSRPVDHCRHTKSVHSSPSSSAFPLLVLPSIHAIGSSAASGPESNLGEHRFSIGLLWVYDVVSIPTYISAFF